MKWGIIGYGISGKSAERLLKKLGHEVVIYDDNIPGYKNNEILYCDSVMISPGIKLSHPIVQKLMKKDIEIIGEIELAYRYMKGKLIAITGTNGKTTTTAWVGHTLSLKYDDVFIGGNMFPGEPFTGFVLNTTDDSWSVVEVSSFQLMSIKEFKPNAAVITNISPDHLNWHKDMEEYLHAKMNIFSNMDSSGVRVLNFDDPQLKKIGLGGEEKYVWFSKSLYVYPGTFLNGKEIVFHIGENVERVINIDDLGIPGMHNVENFMAVISMLMPMGMDVEILKESGRTFKGVPHRMEIVGNYENRLFVNNSMCTNPVAFASSSSVYNPNQVLIVGGQGKNVSSEKIIESIVNNAKYVVLIGEVAEELAKKLEEHNYKNYKIATSMKEAVILSVEVSSKGDAVVLCPGFASFDWFKNFSHRGDVFKEIVKEMFDER